MCLPCLHDVRATITFGQHVSSLFARCKSYHHPWATCVFPVLTISELLSPLSNMCFPCLHDVRVTITLRQHVSSLFARCKSNMCLPCLHDVRATITLGQHVFSLFARCKSYYHYWAKCVFPVCAMSELLSPLGNMCLPCLHDVRVTITLRQHLSSLFARCKRYCHHWSTCVFPICTM